MRAGHLKHRGEIVGSGTYWMGLSEKEAADAPLQTGLRLPTLVAIRARAAAPLAGGQHVRIGARLFYLTSVRDPTGRRAEWVASAVELAGQPAAFQPKEGGAVATRVHILPDVVYVGEQRTEFRHRAEVPLVECPRPQSGDQLILDNATYKVIAPIEGEDDGIVRALWVKPL